MEKILIQDPDGDILTVLTYILAEEGYDVYSVRSYSEAVLAVETFNPDVVLLDFAFYGDSCKQACTVIKRRFPKVPVIAVTCNKFLFKSYSDGLFDAFIEKPFDIYEFIQLIRKYTISMKSLS